MTNAEFLASVEGFRTIEPKGLEDIAKRTQERTFVDGQFLIRAGESGDQMYVIRNGRVRVPIVDKQGLEKMVAHLGPGDLVGEMALMTGEARIANVIAEGEVSVLCLDRKTVEPLLGEYPQLARFLTEILGRRLEEGPGLSKVGKYRLIAKLGEGSSGKVYEALHPTLNRVVAIKMLSHSLVYDKKFCSRFMEEARTIASLSHPNIVQVYDTESAYATYFIVMEKISGSDLATMLRRKPVLGIQEAARILSQIGQGLAYAHSKGYAHRDVKPANIAIMEDGRVKIMDFGLACPIVTHDQDQRLDSVDGTPQYIAPETALGRVADGRVDIYALGVMAFEMLSGRLPFESTNVVTMLKAHVRKSPPDIAQLRPELPQGLIRFVRGSLEKDPDRRLCDWDEIQALLTENLTTEIQTATDLEQVIRVRYAAEAEMTVNEGIDRLIRHFGEDPLIQVAWGRLEIVEANPTGEVEDE